MAAELGKFISEQLAKLPADHPDREHLEDMRRFNEVYQNKATVDALDVLLLRERRVLGLIAQGFNNRTIARTLNIEEKTVENYINGIYSKVGVSRKKNRDSRLNPRVKAVLWYQDNTSSFINPFCGQEIPAFDFSPRQTEVALLIGQGYSSGAIAQTLGVSGKTVEIHVSNMFHILQEKIELDSKAYNAMVAIALISQTKHVRKPLP